jgi:hypothetical protein
METSNKLIGEQLSLWTSSAADIPVNHLVKQASEKEQTTQDTCGLGCEQPLANYDQATQSWRTLEGISLWGDYKLLENLPKSGMTRNGVLYQQQEWVRPIDATESLSWPTPTAVSRPMEGNVRMYRAKIEAGEMTEEEAETILGKSVWEAQGKIPASWPTPTARDWKGAAGFKSAKRNMADLTFLAQVRDGHRLSEYPTMSANGMGNTGSQQILQRKVESGEMTEEEKKRMTAGNGGSLNPTWVEWLMGFPTGWTDLKD